MSEHCYAGWTCRLIAGAVLLLLMLCSMYFAALLQTFKPRVDRHELTVPKSPLLRTKLRSHTVCAYQDAARMVLLGPCSFSAGACHRVIAFALLAIIDTLVAGCVGPDCSPSPTGQARRQNPGLCQQAATAVTGKRVAAWPTTFGGIKPDVEK